MFLKQLLVFLLRPILEEVTHVLSVSSGLNRPMHVGGTDRTPILSTTLDVLGDRKVNPCSSHRMIEGDVLNVMGLGVLDIADIADPEKQLLSHQWYTRSRLSSQS
jgi:hypothetical protein